MCIDRVRSLYPRVMNRQILQLLCHQMRHKSNSSAAAAPAPAPAAAAAAASNIVSVSDWPLMLSEEQRDRCMTKLRSLPAYQRPPTMPHNKREKSSAAVLIALCMESET